MPRQIMLVEDNPDDEALTRRALDKSGFELELSVARDGREALEYLFREGQYQDLPAARQPDLIFLDLKLPFVSGIEVLERLKSNERTRMIPVVVLSSSGQDEDIAKSYVLGVNSYVRKRVDAVEFQDTMRDTLSYWFEFSQLPKHFQTK